MIACVKRRKSSRSMPHRLASTRSPLTPIRARISSVSALCLSAMPVPSQIRNHPPSHGPLPLVQRQALLDAVVIRAGDGLAPRVDTPVIDLRPELEVPGLLDRFHKG